MSASKGTGAGAKADDAKNLKQTRRRLSVMSDNKLIEGMDNVNLDEKEAAAQEVYLTSLLTLILSSSSSLF